MTSKKVLLLRLLTGALATAVIATFGASGCGSAAGDCQSLCVQAQACDKGAQGSASQREAECTSLCNKEEKLVEAASCADAFDAAIACVESAPDICKAGTECTGGTGMPTKCTGPCIREDDALTACIETFCKDPKHASLCQL